MLSNTKPWNFDYLAPAKCIMTIKSTNMLLTKSVLTPLVIFLGISIAAAQPAREGLTVKEAASEAEKVIKEFKGQFEKQAHTDWERRKIQIGPDSLLFHVQVFGEKPVDGRSLYISMHGGGNGPAKMNDQQYKNQQRLYKPFEGVYFVPRAPSNTWNMWHQGPLDKLFERVIADAVLMEGVNPNKVYLMGYSAGGDGVFQLATRMADHWAAAAMMAGHPGDAQVLNLRNLPFFLAVGELDAAYNRNGLAKVWAQTLDSLQAADTGGYIHDAHIMAGMPHWMKQQDTIAVPWMAQFKRNPLPRKVNWIQDDETRDHFYWLSVPGGSARKGHTVIASFKGQEVTVERNETDTLYVLLNDKMMNLDKKIVVKDKGKVIFEGKVVRKKKLIRQSYSERHDPEYIFSAGIVLTGGKAQVL